MFHSSRFSRRTFLTRSTAAGIGLAAAAGFEQLPHGACAAETQPDVKSLVRGIVDSEIRAGVEAAIVKNLLPAIREELVSWLFHDLRGWRGLRQQQHLARVGFVADGRGLSSAGANALGMRLL